MKSFRVAQGRSLRLPPTKLKRVTVPKGVIRVCEPGTLLAPGMLLDESYIAWAAGKVEGNGKTLLANLIADAAIIEV